MAEVLKNLGQANPAVATLTDIYTVPSATSTVVSSIIVANRSATATSFRISVAVSGIADEFKQYLYYDITIQGNDTFAANLGVTLAATDVVRVYATLATLSFNVFGSEVT